MKDAQARNIYLKDYQPPAFLIDETRLHFSLYEDHAVVWATLRIRRNPDASNRQAPLVLHGQELELLAVEVDGQALTGRDYSLDAESLKIPDLPETFTLKSRVRIQPQDNTSLEGLYKSGGMFCTQCEAEGFRKITYYLDRPDVLSSFTTTIEADKQRYPVLLSNGNNIDSGDCIEPGRHWVTWRDPFRKPSYLFALVAGDLRSVDDHFTTRSGREVALRIFVEEKDLDKCDFAMRSLKKAMVWDEEVYGREYDLDTFMIVAVDDFNMGAMENKGLNIFNTSCVLANTATSTDASFQRIEAIVAHEYFHNWSGNRVTCRDWFQLSLKEGFTVYRDAEFSADMGSRAVKRIDDVNFLRTLQFAEDAGPMAHAVRPESYMEISNFYTVTVYEKGAEVVRMIANLLGPVKFREGTDRYFEKYDGKAVTTEDFVSTMEEVSGLDLTQFRYWYTQAGTPELTVNGRFDPERHTYTLSVKQSCPPTPGQPRKDCLYIPLTVGLLDSQGRELPLRLAGESEAAVTSKVLTVSRASQDFVFTEIPEQPVPSLLRGFSAPVKLHVDYSRDDLVFLMSHDTDGFTRWEAFQRLSIQILNDLLLSHQSGSELVLDERLVTAMKQVLDRALDEDADQAMTARLLHLPSEAYIAEQAKEVDVDGIHDVREFMRREVAAGLCNVMAGIYDALNVDAPYEVDAASIGRRSLKNGVLTYLTLLEEDNWPQRCYDQYRRSDNMTDQSAALRALMGVKSPWALELRDEALDRFYAKWQDEPLVIEQWFAIQAGHADRDNLPRVLELTRHKAFDIRNPNKVRSVIGAFCHQNLVGFHHPSGSGYHFLAEQVITLNKLNPQIAARLMTPLTQWKRHNRERRELMKAELKRILKIGDLSKDVYEVASKGLKS